MQKFAVRDYTATPGNRGAWCPHRAEGDVTHFVNLTFWDDFERRRLLVGCDLSLDLTNTFSKRAHMAVIQTKLALAFPGNWILPHLRSVVSVQSIVT
jgi:hypothetical protein